MATKKKIFNVLEYDFNNRTRKYYDVLPYFRNSWKKKSYQHMIDDGKKPSNKKELKNWIINASQYQFWSRCEYEFLMGAWPFGSHKMNEDIMEYLNNHPGFNIKDYNDNVDFINIIIKDMYLIDVHEQIMMNIDIITDILAVEFKIN
jgi:hypothetical protein